VHPIDVHAHTVLALMIGCEQFDTYACMSLHVYEDVQVVNVIIVSGVFFVSVG